MKIKVKPVLEALDLKRPPELALFLGYTRQAGYLWGEELPELACFRLLEKRPELRRLAEKDAG